MYTNPFISSYKLTRGRPLQHPVKGVCVKHDTRQLHMVTRGRQPWLQTLALLVTEANESCFIAPYISSLHTNSRTSATAFHNTPPTQGTASPCLLDLNHISEPCSLLKPTTLLPHKPPHHQVPIILALRHSTCFLQTPLPISLIIPYRIHQPPPSPRPPPRNPALVLLCNSRP